MQINKRETRQPNIIRKLLERPRTGPQPKVAQSSSVTIEDMSHQENLKIQSLLYKDSIILEDEINMEENQKFQ